MSSSNVMHGEGIVAALARASAKKVEELVVRKVDLYAILAMVR